MNDPDTVPPPPGLRSPGLMAALLVSLGGFVLLAALAGHRPSTLDRAAASALGATRGTLGFRLGEAVSVVGSGLVVGLLAVVFGGVVLWWTRELLIAAVVPVAAAGAGAVELMAKHLVQRPRPVTATLTGESGYGFPSGHTTGFTALLVASIGVLAILSLGGGRGLIWRFGAGAAALAVGTSRIVVGAHWATDVVGGLLLGTAVGLAVPFVAYRSALVVLGRGCPGSNTGVPASRPPVRAVPTIPWR